MAGENNDQESKVSIPVNITKFTLDPIDHALAAYSRQVLKQGIPVHSVIELYLNHMASVVSMVEPAQAREILIKDLVGSFAGMVRQHVDAKYTTKGGIVLPGADVPRVI